ncbi:MAG TPA: lipid-A-disaccharide synthase [Sunxiuqinia sp.]|nr:lipid-A-disaccharide synthase [Sunxiuqinia sp.]
MKYYVIAGEASGDLHASNLIKELVSQDPDAELRGFGGELMEEAGMTLVKHYRDMAFMGIIPVLLNLRTIKKNFNTCEQDLLNFKPDVLILVDYPGFNLRMAEFAKKNGIRVFYYISPKIWAWKTHRIKKIKAFVDELFTILPFETEFYKGHDFEVNYVGNPVLDAVLAKTKKQSFTEFTTENQLENKPVIALLPGSRMQEIHDMLPRFLKTASAFSDYQMVVTAAPNIDDSVYQKLMGNHQAILLRGKTYEVLQQADVALLTSGTVSLEAGILRCPQLVCYRMAGGAFFYPIGRMIIKVQWASLVNLILNREAVREFFQHQTAPANLHKEVKRILTDSTYKKQMLESYEELHQLLGEPGASKRAASLIIEKLGGGK